MSSQGRRLLSLYNHMEHTFLSYLEEDRELFFPAYHLSLPAPFFYLTGYALDHSYFALRAFHYDIFTLFTASQDQGAIQNH